MEQTKNEKQDTEDLRRAVRSQTQVVNRIARGQGLVTKNEIIQIFELVRREEKLAAEKENLHSEDIRKAREEAAERYQAVLAEEKKAQAEQTRKTRMEELRRAAEETKKRLAGKNEKGGRGKGTRIATRTRRAGKSPMER